MIIPINAIIFHCRGVNYAFAKAASTDFNVFSICNEIDLSDSYSLGASILYLVIAHRSSSSWAFWAVPDVLELAAEAHEGGRLKYWSIPYVSLQY